MQETAAVARTLALAELAAERPLRLNEATPTAEAADRNGRCKATCHATLFPLCEPIAIPLSPFMHNVEVSGVPKARPLDRRVGQRPAASTPACQTTTTVPTASIACKTETGHGHSGAALTHCQCHRTCADRRRTGGPLRSNACLMPSHRPFASRSVRCAFAFAQWSPQDAQRST